MDEVGGLWNRLPILAFFMILAALGSAAVPGLNGFVGEFPILIGMFAQSRWAAVLATAGMILGATYLLLMVKKVIFGPLHEPGEHSHGQGADDAHPHAAVEPVGWHEIAGLTPLMVLIVVIGTFPSFFLDRIRPAVSPINGALQAQRQLADVPRQAQLKDPHSTPTTTAGLGLSTTASTNPAQKGR